MDQPPIDNPPQAQPAAQPSVQPPVANIYNTPNQTGVGKKLLIVEDDFYIRDVYKIVAQHRGYIVYTASDGEDGLRLAQLTHPDFILLDIMLPKMNGIEVLKSLKATTELKNIPVILVTNVSEASVRQQAAQAGAADYIIKSQKPPLQIIMSLPNYLQPQPIPQ